MKPLNPQNETKSLSGRIGGLQTFLRYGREGMSARGKLGGRPRALTLEDIIRQSQPFQSPGINEQRRMDTHYVQTNNLVKLQRLWRDRQKTMKAEIAQTPPPPERSEVNVQMA